MTTLSDAVISFFAFCRCLCTDFRHLDFNRLIFVLDIVMNGKLCAVTVEAFKHYNVGVGFDEFGIKGKGYDNLARGVLRG